MSTGPARALADQVIEAAAADLTRAYRRHQAGPPLSENYPGLTIDDAYRIQLRQVAMWQSMGQRVVGYKIGLVSAAMRAQMGVDEPDYGHLMDPMVRSARQPLESAGFLQPLAEPELGFVLGRPLRGPGLVEADVLAATEYVVPVLEIVDSRIADWNLSIVDTIADNASSGAVFVGDARQPPRHRDLARISCRLAADGTTVATGIGADVAGSPVTAVTWLANTLGHHGVELAVGSLVLSGSFTRALPLIGVRRIGVEFSGLGDISIDIA